MSKIYGTAINMEHIDDKTTYLLKVLFTINTPIPEKILFNILKRQNLRTMEESNQDIAKRCTSAVGLNIVHKITYNINTEESYYFIYNCFCYGYGMRLNTSYKACYRTAVSARA